MDFPYAEVEQKLGYVFHNKKLLQQAFTHSSYSNRYGTGDNERMEYLGDSVLQLIVTEWQYRNDAQASEGKLTAKRQKLVCKDALDSAVDALGIWQYLLASGTEYNVRGKAKSSLFEAVAAAIYLDGGYKAAKRFVLEHGNVHFDVQVGNPKGELKEFLEKRGAEEPVYEVEKTGKDNSPYFHCVAYALGESAKGEGRTKKEAEATAAARLLWELEKRTQSPVKKRKK
ncbi:MAG: ribonuclease III [Clostridia bacterium]|nr:ribonuclease III [Clostridia bacterium]